MSSGLEWSAAMMMTAVYRHLAFALLEADHQWLMGENLAAAQAHGHDAVAGFLREAHEPCSAINIAPTGGGKLLAVVEAHVWRGDDVRTELLHGRRGIAAALALANLRVENVSLMAAG